MYQWIIVEIVIIIDYVLCGHCVPTCPKCFIRIVSLDLHLKPGGESYFILYSLNEETEA